MDKMSKIEKRYFSYIIVSFILCGLMSLLVGCNDKIVENEVQASQTDKQTQEKQEQKVIPSFSVATYNTPFIEFEYPKLWDDSDDVQNYGDKDTIKVIVGDEENATCITVKQIFDKNIQSADQSRTQFIIMCDSMQSIEYLDKTSYLNKNIAILEGVVYGKSEIRAKEYFWNDGKGKTYQIEISSENDNWDNIKEVIQVFEQSLKFKK